MSSDYVVLDFHYKSCVLEVYNLALTTGMWNFQLRRKCVGVLFKEEEKSDIFKEGEGLLEGALI